MPQYVYILANRRHGTLYVGLTRDLLRRVHQHRTGAVAGFTRTHDIKRLVYYEVHEDLYAALRRERTLKRWRRDWKIALIERDNPDWRDLFTTISP